MIFLTNKSHIILIPLCVCVCIECLLIKSGVHAFSCIFCISLACIDAHYMYVFIAFNSLYVYCVYNNLYSLDAYILKYNFLALNTSH